jgi:acyl-CoA oxidase
MLLGRGIKAQVDDVRSANVEDLHLQTVGAKIWATEHGVRDVEVARLSCGGHGEFPISCPGFFYVCEN